MDSTGPKFARHGNDPFGLRSRLRLLRFIQAVDGGAPNLLAAALSAGFGSYSQCHRIFQQTFACTPRLFFETSLRDEMQNAFAPWAASPLPAQ